MMNRWAHFFQRLEAAKKIRAYMAQNLEREDKFHVELEMAKAPTMSVRKAVEEEVELLKRAELENEAL